VASAWDEAFASDRPVLFEALVDPDVPTLPPDLMDQQRQKLEQALSGGDERAATVRRQLQLEGYRVGGA
jgi:pyruvate dehydrogenase (quinone)